MRTAETSKERAARQAIETVTDYWSQKYYILQPSCQKQIQTGSVAMLQTGENRDQQELIKPLRKGGKR